MNETTLKKFSNPVVCLEKVPGELYFSSPGAIELNGWAGSLMTLCINNRVADQEIQRLIEPFLSRDDSFQNGFRCEFWGKWFTSAVLASLWKQTPELSSLIEEGYKAILSTAEQDGRISTYAEECQLGTWDVWGRKYVLLGFLSHYEATGDPDALVQAGKQVDLLMERLKSANVKLADTGWPDWKGLPPASILEPVVLLYKYTGNNRYLEFAQSIVQQWSEPSEWTSAGLRLVEDALDEKEPLHIGAPKAYEAMSCYEGLCEMYRVTGERKYLDAVMAYARGIQKSERMIIGSGSNHELWCEGTRHQTETLEQPLETCVTVTWMKLCAQLLRITGDPQWADEMELSLYNALSASMTPDGSWWSYYSPLLGERVASHHQYADVGLSCCVANGPRALLMTPKWAVMTDENGPVVNLYEEGNYRVSLKDGARVALRQQTCYPLNNEVIIYVDSEQDAEFTLSLRIPAYSQHTLLDVNGESVDCQPGAYVRIKRQWRPGDQVRLGLDFRGRVIPAPSGAPQFAIMRGPIVLALDSRFTVGEDKAVRLLMDEPGYVALKPSLLKDPAVRMAFDVVFDVHPIHIRHEELSLSFCDYASAGNAWNPENMLRVWLPQPLYLRHAFVPDTWRLMYPGHDTRPVAP